MPHRKVIFSLVVSIVFIVLCLFIASPKVFAQVAGADCCDRSDCPKDGCSNGPNYCDGDYVKNVKTCATWACDGASCPSNTGVCHTTSSYTTISHSDPCTYGCSGSSCNPAPSTCDGTTYPQLCDGGTGVQTCKGKGGTYDPGCNPDCTACQTKYKCSGTSCVADGNGGYTSSTCSDSCNPSPTCDASLCGPWINASCGGDSCALTQRQQTRTCPGGSTCPPSQCVSDPTCGTAPPPPPAPPPTPTISPSPSLNCIYQGYSGSGFTISWTSSNPAVTYVDISTDNFFTWYTRAVSGTSATAPSGFSGWQGVSGPLTFSPGTTYYVRLWNGSQHSATATFTTPVACITLSGYVKDNNGVGMANIPLIDYSCQGSGSPLKWSPVTDSNGYYSISDVPVGAGFCLRVSDTLTTYTASYTRTSGTYEWQVAGQWQPAGQRCALTGSSCSNPQIACTTSHESYDLCADSSYNFTYTPISTPAGNLTATGCTIAWGSSSCAIPLAYAYANSPQGATVCLRSTPTDRVKSIFGDTAKPYSTYYWDSIAATGSYTYDLRTGYNVCTGTSLSTSTAVVDRNNAQYISQSCPPSSVTSGQSASVRVQMKNTGTTTWTESNSYRLGSQNPPDNTAWGIARVSLGPTIVRPNAGHNFSFTATAPGTPGTYNWQWQMVQDGVEWFGDLTPNCPVTVSLPAPPAPTISISPSLGCIASGYDGLGITMSWTNNSTPVTWIDISSDSFQTYYHKQVIGGTAYAQASTDGTGFNGYQGVSGPLTYNPDTTYQVRLYNGVLGPWDTFNISACVSVSVAMVPAITCFPKAGVDGSGITFSWTQPGTDDYAQIQVSLDQTFAGYYYGETSVVDRQGLITAKQALANHVGLYSDSSNLPPYNPLPSVYYVRFFGGGSYPYYSNPVPFSMPACMSAWIQVTGDVHSNTSIKAPGGP